MITKYLWRAHYQSLLLILLKEFIKLNVNIDMKLKNVKRAKLNTKIASAVLNTQHVKDDLIGNKYLCHNKNYQKTFDEKFSNHDINKFILLL